MLFQKSLGMKEGRKDVWNGISYLLLAGDEKSGAWALRRERRGSCSPPRGREKEMVFFIQWKEERWGMGSGKGRRERIGGSFFACAVGGGKKKERDTLGRN